MLPSTRFQEAFYGDASGRNNGKRRLSTVNALFIRTGVVGGVEMVFNSTPRHDADTTSQRRSACESSETNNRF